MLDNETSNMVQQVHKALKIVADDLVDEGPAQRAVDRYMEEYTYSKERITMNCELITLISEVLGE